MLNTYKLFCITVETKINIFYLFYLSVCGPKVQGTYAWPPMMARGLKRTRQSWCSIHRLPESWLIGNQFGRDALRSSAAEVDEAWAMGG